MLNCLRSIGQALGRTSSLHRGIGRMVNGGKIHSTSPAHKPVLNRSTLRAVKTRRNEHEKYRFPQIGIYSLQGYYGAFTVVVLALTMDYATSNREK